MGGEGREGVLIRVLRDGNLPKFLKDDAVPFQVSHMTEVYLACVFRGMAHNLC